MASRFSSAAFRGRVRTRVLLGLLILSVALSYGTWSTRRFGSRGSERQTFDQPVVEMAGRMVRRPDRIPDVPVTTLAEMELAAVARDQQDLLFGMTVLLMRLLATGTVAGIGLVLLTAGSTEWEIRSEAQG
ncbi:hypothetical protein [Luteitalea sp. TBR-22]|uniref:hypothetical protein n=1 Tax=Luteitalea sp. TBR-22 TaxID=2802971 RepID=UPI001EF3EB76|nr:hypothetical protein [Luteitalea sp. TBR-22]